MCRHRRAPVAAHAHTPGLTRRAVRRHMKMAMDKINTFTLPSCAASFTCSPFTCRQRLPLDLQHQQEVTCVKRVLDATMVAAA